MEALGMTKPEDIEKLLNHFCVTISDLPKSDGRHLTYDRDLRSNAEHQVFAFAGKSGLVDIIDCLAMHQDYIMHQSDVIEKLVTALEVANNRIQGIRETATCMAENCRPWEDQRDAGFDEACMEIVELIDSYSIWKGEEKSADE